MPRQKRSTGQRVLEAIHAAMKSAPTAEDEARQLAAPERAGKLLAFALQWERDLEEGVIDRERDRLLERIDKIIEPRSPEVRAQKAIVRGWALAREQKEGAVAFVRRWVANHEPAALDGVDDGAIERAIAGTPVTKEYREHSIKNGACAVCKSKSALGKCRRAWPDGVKARDQAVLELLRAAGVALGGDNPAATIDSYAYPR